MDSSAKYRQGDSKWDQGTSSHLRDQKRLCEGGGICTVAQWRRISGHQKQGRAEGTA